MALFSPRANATFRSVLVAAFALAIALPLGLLAWARTPTATGQYSVVRQPIPFDHRVHVTALRIDCRYCHSTVERSAIAGMPATSVCVPCHSQLWLNSSVMAPVRRSVATGRPITWQRVNRLPDFVFFNHAIHVKKGVGCESCHGRVDQMQSVYQAVPLTMNWCLSCHRQPEQHLRPVAAITTMGWSPPAGSRRALGRLLARRYNVRELTTCSTCHR